MMSLEPVLNQARSLGREVDLLRVSWTNTLNVELGYFIKLDDSGNDLRSALLQSSTLWYGMLRWWRSIFVPPTSMKTRI